MKSNEEEKLPNSRMKNNISEFGCGISKLVGPKKQDFWPRINILEGKKIKKFC